MSLNVIPINNNNDDEDENKHDENNDNDKTNENDPVYFLRNVLRFIVNATDADTTITSSKTVFKTTTTTTTTTTIITSSSKLTLFGPSITITTASNPNSNESNTDVQFNPNAAVRSLNEPTAELQISLYSIIFFLALVGNLLIIVTLIQNKRMRTVTNVFLLNLAISDLLLALVCMPFTLVPVLLKDFIFGAFMCVFIRYLQAVSVGVSCFTLVAISLERYFAICRPLHSRSWQTLSHSYRCIVVCWILSAALMSPTAIFQKHLAFGNGAHLCREVWPNVQLERAYMVFLDLILLIMPVVLMSVAYSRVVHTLMYDVRSSMDMGVPEDGADGKNFILRNYRTIELRLLHRDSSCRSVTSYTSTDTSMSQGGSITPPKCISRSDTLTSLGGRKSCRSVTNRIRHSNPQLIRKNKIRVIRMLFVVVLEFFLCWTPLYVLQTWMVFHSESAYQAVTPFTKMLLHLLSYFSSCVNPITYCFMNKKFREAFLRVFQCRSPPQTIRERRMMQLHLQHKDKHRNSSTSSNNHVHNNHNHYHRRSTAVSRLSEQFNPRSSTSSVMTSDSFKMKQPVLDRCRKVKDSHIDEEGEFNPSLSD